MLTAWEIYCNDNKGAPLVSNNIGISNRPEIVAPIPEIYLDVPFE